MTNSHSCGGDCASCSGCASCGGCGGAISLTEGEIAMIRTLGQIPFLPVARKMDNTVPIYLEDADRSPGEYTQILLHLERKGLISLDFDKPLANFDDAAYRAYPIRGSMALTKRGLDVLEVLETQGISE